MPSLEFRRVLDRKSTRLNSSHTLISYAVFCLKKKQLSGIKRRFRDPQPRGRFRAPRRIRRGLTPCRLCPHSPCPRPFGRLRLPCFFFKALGAPQFFPFFPTHPLAR